VSPTRRRLEQLADHSLWLVPTACVAASLGLAAGTLALDRGPLAGTVPLSWTGSATAAQNILSTAASSMLSLVTVVLTVLTLALQFAMQQFSPRIVRSLFQDRPSQLAHGLFAGTFVYCVLALRSIDDQAQSGGVPTLTVLMAYALVLASLLTLVVYVHHAGRALRVAALVDLVGDHLREQIDAVYPAPSGAPPVAAGVVAAPAPGVVTQVDTESLVEAARARDCRLRLLVAMGDFVPAGAPLLACTCDGPHDGLEDLVRHVVLSNERTHEHDVAYGFRKLVDMAERSVASSAFNDPTTAVQAIDRLHDCLRQLARRDLAIGEHRDGHGEVRFVLPVLDWDGYVRLAFDEVRLAGAGSPQVTRRLQAALEDLSRVVPEHRLPAVRRQQALLEAGAQDQYADDRDSRAALVADAQGIGSGVDVLLDRHAERTPRVGV
jgi:uncharacterized membrane protein